MLYHRHKSEWQVELKKKEEIITSLQKMCQRSLMEKKKTIVDVDKENKPPNILEPKIGFGDFLRKKNPSNPMSINFQKPFESTNRDTLVIASSRLLGQSISDTDTINRPSTAAGPRKTRESEYLSNMLKSNKALGADFCEMFKKKKANANIIMSGSRSPTSYEYPTSILDSRMRLNSSYGERRSEIEHILLNLLEEHKEVKNSDNKLCNKVEFIERAIKG